MKILITAALMVSLAAACAAATHQVDCAKPEGKDLNRVNQLTLGPGDKVLLKSGCVWKGQQLALKGSGAPGNPILVDRYGSGARPRIDGAGAVEDAVLVKNQQHIEIRNLEITNRGASPAVRRGVHVWLDDFGTGSHIVIANLYIHDVNGDNRPKDNGGVIWRTTGKSTPTRFDGLRIEGNIVWKVDRSAIAAVSAFVDRRRWFPSLNVVIRDNYVEDIGGDGIVPWASDGAQVEHNIAKDCNKRAGSYNAGIWPWSCDNTVMRLNEAMYTRTTKDGQGFDSDYNSRNTTIEFNYSHHNEGGFLLICTPKHDNPEHMVTNIGVEVRYNISRDDLVRTFHLPGPVEKVRIHNNAVYTGPGITVNIAQFSDWKGWPNDVEFRDNLFHVEGTGRYGHEIKRYPDGNFDIAPGVGPSTNIRFHGNTYIGNHVDRPEDPAAKTKAERLITNWDSPQFDPARPDDFPAYLKKHRQWMIALFEKQFGRRP